MVEATARLGTMPGAGAIYEQAEDLGVHRLLLPRTSHHVYYVVDDVKRVVTVLAVWHSARGHGPPLR